MKILSEYLADAATPRSSRKDRSVSFDLDLCKEEFLAANSSSVFEARAGDGDGDELCKGSIAENLTFCISHRISECLVNETGSGGDDDDDDDDDLQWANARLPLRPVLRRSGYGDGKALLKVSSLWGKENKATFTRKHASFSMTTSGHAYAGPLRPHSRPFSGPLTPLAKQSTCGKSSRVPSIIPINLLRRKVLNACEPMSPEVTCLGRIRCKELDISCKREETKADVLSVDSQTVQKGRCFESENQLCGKRCKGRKKKEKARRRFASTETKTIPLELGQTRREKAASLARSLTDMLEDMRQFEKESVHYEPSVPPPNSLLLMRGCRAGDKEMDMGSGRDQEWTNDSVHAGLQDELIAPPPNSLLLMRGCKIRGNLSLPLELLMDRIPSQTEHAQASPTSISKDFNRDAHHVKKRKARAARHFSLLDLIDKEENLMDEGVSTFKVRDTVSTEGGNALHVGSSIASEGIRAVHAITKEKVVPGNHRKATLCQRRSFGELPQIEVKLCTRMNR
ncbi:hypothetical protein L7F22_060701 [Adiantum nelumboides]|nr:hypothetical protein [Adiantum nelumboides]